MIRMVPFVFLLLLLSCAAEEQSNTIFPEAESVMEENVEPAPPGTPTSGNNSPEENSFPNGDSRILFVGNSLTYSNNLPEIVKERAVQKGYKVTADVLAKPNYAILDHWAEGEVQEMVKNGNYDYLVIQQGPSSQAWGRQVLFEYGEKFNALCSSNGVKLVYFMVWPSRSYYDTFPGVITNYRDASNNTNSILCPVGEVWKNYFDRTNDFSYYGVDGFHPSLQGSLVAAQVITDRLYRKPKN